MKGKKCPNCGVITVQGAYQCPNCETILGDVRVEQYTSEEVEKSQKVNQPQSSKANLNLEECSDCGGLVSQSADSCPHCGKKSTKPLGCLIAIAVAVVLLVVFILASLQSSESKNSSDETIASSDQVLNERELNELIANSDDLNLYRDTFRNTTSKLIDAGACNPNNGKDVIEMGGWLKSTDFKEESVYFTYCYSGKVKAFYSVKDRIYLNISTDEIFR